MFIAMKCRLNSAVSNTSVYCLGALPSYKKVVVTLSNESVYGPWSKSLLYFLFLSGYLHWTETNSGAPVPRAAQNDGVMDIRLALSRIAHDRFTFLTRDSFISRGIG
ncbi:unnamed protein product [Adineta steineri]|uniref:Uncharacterized protein n=1 Tax=Adineta steineri TaxID=433720 RepID=A0A814J815_9BILA|nr:unnamed protein product [Adineta steineri]CAF1067847.1 unnamed protein product [Adineta steineri]